MTIKQYRKRLALSYRQFGALFDKSAARMCEIERANYAPPALALEIEKHSGGLVDAATLNKNIAEARKVAA